MSVVTLSFEPHGFQLCYVVPWWISSLFYCLNGQWRFAGILVCVGNLQQPGVIQVRMPSVVMAGGFLVACLLLLLLLL